MIAKLQEEKGSPPTFMQIRQHIKKNEIEEFKPDFDHPFWRYTLVWQDKVFVTKCMSYFSMQKWNDEYMTYSERF